MEVLIIAEQTNNKTMENQKTIQAIYLSRIQLDNLYRLDVRKYAGENPEKVITMNSINELKERNNKITFGGEYIVVN